MVRTFIVHRVIVCQGCEEWLTDSRIAMLADQRLLLCQGIVTGDDIPAGAAGERDVRLAVPRLARKRHVDLHPPRVRDQDGIRVHVRQSPCGNQSSDSRPEGPPRGLGSQAIDTVNELETDLRPTFREESGQ
jgi:hypothetical protein